MTFPQTRTKRPTRASKSPNRATTPLRSAAATALLALLVLAAPARADFTRPIGTDGYVVGVAGDGALVVTADRLERITAQAREPLLTFGKRSGVIGAAGSPTRVIAITGGGYFSISDCIGGCPADQGEGTGFGESGTGEGAGTSRTKVFVGPVGKALGEVDACGSADSAPVGPVAAGDAVAWRGCDTESVEVIDNVSRDRYAEGGIVVALAAHDRRVAWIVRREGKRSLVRVLDLDTKQVSTVGTLKPLSLLPALDLSLGSGGRLRAVLSKRACCGELPTCQIRDSRDGGSLDLLPTRDCRRTTLTDTGSIGLPRSIFLLDQPLVARSEPSGARTTLARTRRGGLLSYAVDGERAAFLRPGCLGSDLVVDTIAGARTAPPLATCPVKLLRRTITVRRHGPLVVRVACPRGCALISPTLTTPARRPATFGRGAFVKPGGVARLRFRPRPRVREAILKAGRSRERLLLRQFNGESVTLPVVLRAKAR